MGFEPMTSCLLDRRSNQLSYGALLTSNLLFASDFFVIIHGKVTSITSKGIDQLGNVTFLNLRWNGQIRINSGPKTWISVVCEEKKIKNLQK